MNHRETQGASLLNWVVQLAAMVTDAQAAVLMVEGDDGPSPAAFFGARRIQVQGWLTVCEEWLVIPDVRKLPDGHSMRKGPLRTALAACAPVCRPSEGISASLWVLSTDPRPQGLSDREKACLETLTKAAFEPLLTFYAGDLDYVHPSTSPVSVLVADDEPAFRLAVKLELAAPAFVVSEAQSGRQVLRFVAESQPDVLFIDLAMPDGEGMETIRTLRAEGYRGAIVAVSGAFPSPLLRVAEHLGANACLEKPLPKGSLPSLVGAMLVTQWGKTAGC